MAGFDPTQKQGQGTRFVYIHDFQFKMEASAEDERLYPDYIKERTKEKSGTVVRELATTILTGRLVDVGERDVTFGDGKMNYVTIEDEDGVKYQVSLKYMGRPMLTILKRLPALREDLPIQLGVFKSDLPAKGNQPAISMALVFIRQMDANGKWTKVEDQFPYDPENPDAHEMPSFDKVKIKGQIQYDPTPQYEWLKENAALPYMGRVSKLSASPAPEPKPAAPKGFGQPEAPAPKAKAAPVKEKVDPATAEHIGSEYEEGELPF